MKYIFLISRLASFFIDYIIFYILLYFMGKLGALGYFISLIIFFFYRYLTTAYFGSTLGMMILKLKLKKYDFRVCLKREIYRIASALFYVGYFYAIIDIKGRTFHDIAADTYVYYGGPKEEEEIEKAPIIIAIASALLFVSAIRWSTSFILNEVGFIGLKRIYSSDGYFQSFEGDNLLSLSQEELYKKTLGRKYSTVVDINNEPHIIRISNKLKYTEVYKLNIDKSKMVGEYLYRIDMPIQFICSGKFIKSNDLCGVSPQNKIILVNEYGKTYAQNEIGISNVVTLRCGDLDVDGYDEAVVLGRGGEVEVFKLIDNKLKKIFSGKIGEDIIPQSFYIDDGISVVSKGNDRSILYHYNFKNNKFVFKDKKYFKTKDIFNIAKIGNDVIISNVYRNSMTLKTGKIQRLEVYDIDKKIQRLYDFGSRPAKRYAYMVRTLEGVYDINKDGKEEIILKAVGKEDVMGQGYTIEVYELKKGVLWANRILSKIEGILLINTK